MVFGAKTYRWNLTLLAQTFRTHLGINLPFFVDATGSMSCLWFAYSGSTIKTSDSYMTLFILASILCAHLGPTREFTTIGYLTFVRISRADEIKPSAFVPIPLFVGIQISVAVCWSAGRLVYTWLTLIYTFLIYPKIGRYAGIYIRIPSPYQDMNLPCEHPGSTRKLFRCHSDSSTRSHTNLPCPDIKLPCGFLAPYSFASVCQIIQIYKKKKRFLDHRFICSNRHHAISAFNPRPETNHIIFTCLSAGISGSFKLAYT